jgi:peptidoglycan/xylan/chitin deacetylase (PgdA/CDA1 family)
MGAERPHAGQAGRGITVPDVPEHKGAMAAGRAWQEAADPTPLDGAFLRWSEVEAMVEAGTFEFHSHTHSHTRWDKAIIDQSRRDVALAEDLAASRAALAARLGGDGLHLCWPQGYYDPAYQRVAREAGFRYLYTTEPGVVRADTDPARIPRIVVKDKPVGWFASRLRLYRNPLGAALYLGLKGLG